MSLYLVPFIIQTGEELEVLHQNCGYSPRNTVCDTGGPVMTPAANDINFDEHEPRVFQVRKLPDKDKMDFCRITRKIKRDSISAWKFYWLVRPYYTLVACSCKNTALFDCFVRMPSTGKYSWFDL